MPCIDYELAVNIGEEAPWASSFELKFLQKQGPVLLKEHVDRQISKR